MRMKKKEKRKTQNKKRWRDVRTENTRKLSKDIEFDSVGGRQHKGEEQILTKSRWD